MNSVILPGITIGNNVAIGAGSIVVKDIPSNSVAAGNPCRVIKSKEPYTGDPYEDTFPGNKMRKIIFQVISFSLLILIIYIYQKYRISVFELLVTVNINWFLTGIFFYFLNYCLRALRFHQFLFFATEVKYVSLLKTAGFHGFYNYFLPVRSGDMTLPFLLKLYCSIPVTSGIKLLVRARLQDLITLGGILFCVILSYQLPVPDYTKIILLLFAVALIAGPFAAIYIVRNNVRFIPRKIKVTFEKNRPKYPNVMELFMSFLIWICTGGTLTASSDQ